MIPKKYLSIFLLMLSLFPIDCSSSHPSVAIGVVFSKADWNSTAVKGVDEAVEMINRRDDVLPGMRLIYSPIFSDGNSFKLGKTVCEGISAGVKAVVSQVICSCQFRVWIISDWIFFCHGQPSCSEYLPRAGYSLLSDQGRNSNCGVWLRLIILCCCPALF